MNGQEEFKTSRLELAKALVYALENNNSDAADHALAQLTQANETMLFQKIGQLTRQLHDTMRGFSVDGKFADLTEKEIPDAKERLNYVIKTTEEAADTTINAIDEMLPLSEELGKRSHELSNKWQRFLQREMPYDEFKEMSRDISDFLGKTNDSVDQINTKLTEVLVAQSFQDITGQVIRRVIDLVHNVESNMVDLIRISGDQLVVYESDNLTCSEKASERELEGPVIPGIDSGDTVDNQDDVDELLSSLGF